MIGANGASINVTNESGQFTAHADVIHMSDVAVPGEVKSPQNYMSGNAT
jgi:hypothetical protein